jgi:hypothetical protein
MDIEPAEKEEDRNEEDATGPSIAKSNAMDVVVQSGSQRAIENLLKVYYEPLELWFLRTSIEKVSFVPALLIAISTFPLDVVATYI